MERFEKAFSVLNRCERVLMQIDPHELLRSLRPDWRLHYDASQHFFQRSVFIYPRKWDVEGQCDFISAFRLYSLWIEDSDSSCTASHNILQGVPL